jgi:transcriptional regulator with XRE-family HTH domain
MAELFIKENLKFIREAYGNTQQQMADRLNVPLKRYQSYEEGRNDPPAAQIVDFCCSLNVSIDDFMKINMAVKFTPLAILQLSVKTSKNSKQG